MTLTLKLARLVTGPQGRFYLQFNEYEASKNLKHVLNVVNAHIYGNRRQRGNAKVRVLPVLEGGVDNIRYHYHLMIDCPRPEWSESLPNLLTEAWRASHWGYNQVHIVPDANNGWVDYITKLKTKVEGLGASIDWLNYNNTYYCW